MIDGLGLVYEKQGNTGAGAYNQPVLGIGQNPIDRIAAGIGDQVSIERQKQYIQQKENEKLNQQALEVGGSGWEVDNDRQLGQYLNAMKNEYVNLQIEGVKPTDYNNPKSKRYWELKQGWENLKNNSLAQKDQFNKAYQMVLGDLNSPTPQFDHPQTFEKMKAWQNLPIEERMKTPIDQLLVKKEKPYDMYSLSRDIDLSKGFVGKSGYENEQMSNSSTKLNKENLLKALELEATNPKNKENYEFGLGKGYWDNPKEYAQVNYDWKKQFFTPDSTYEKKAPKGRTIVNINNGNSSELMGELGVGTQKMTVPIYDVNNKNTGKNYPTTIDNVTQLNNINATVNWASAIDATKGETFKNTGSFALQSGALALPLVRKGTNRILATDGLTFTYKDSKGKENTLTGTSKQDLEQKMVQSGIAEYKPMIFGSAVDQQGYGKTKTTDVWIPADAVLHGAGNSNKALNEGQYAYEVYKKRADDLNKEAVSQASLKGGQNKPATQKSYKNSATLQDGKVIYTNDKGETWWYADGKQYTQ